MAYTPFLKDYLGAGTFASRPNATTLGATIPAGSTVFYFATDTGALYALQGGGTSWVSPGVTLASIADKRILANISGGSAAPVANSFSDIVDSATSTTQGSILYRGASGWVALAPGTAGQVLVSGGSGANPSWSSAAAGGNVAIKDEGSTLTSAVASIDFTGAGVTATNTGSAVTVNIPGGGGGGIASSGVKGETRVHLSSNSGTLVWSYANEVTWAYPPDYDNLGAVALSGFPMNLYVPTGVTYAKINAQGAFNTYNASAAAAIVSFAPATSVCRILGAGGATANGQFNISTGWVPVTAGDLVKLMAHPGGSGNYLVGGSLSTTYNPSSAYLFPVTQMQVLWGDNSVITGGA